MKEKGTDESLSSPKVRSLGSLPVGEVKAFSVSSLSSAAEQRRFVMTIGLSSSRNSSRWKRKTVTDRRKRLK